MMEKNAFKESSKIASDFKNEKVLEAVHESIACPTPQKNTEEPLTIKSKEEQTNIPHKYRTLAELFDHMGCSLRLLRLCRKIPTFENISRQVEVFSKRKFSHAHLAQIKYILPEGVCIEKVLVHNKKSLCMVPDMKITLCFEVVDDCSGESAYLALRRHFNSRLIDYFNMHPEVADIPEAVLPEPFSKKACNLNCEDSHVKEFTCQSPHVNSSAEFLSISNEVEMLPEKYELYPAFSRHFSRKDIGYDQAEKVQCTLSTKTSPSSYASDCLDMRESEKLLQEECDRALLSDHVVNLHTEGGHQKESFSMSSQPSVINTPVHMISPPHSVTCNNSESTDMKNLSTAADSFMTETPAQSAPARLLPISDVKPQNTPTQKSTLCHKPAKRVLDFSLMEGNDDLDIRVDKLESSRPLYEVDSFPKPGRGRSKDCNTFDSVSVLQEAEESLSDSFEKITQNQAGLETRHKKYSPLPDLVNVIHSIFQSVNITPITKEELLQKILMNSLDFVDIREVKEQVEYLESLVPDWICKKSVLTGDMYCIKKVPDLDSVRSRLSSNGTVWEKGFTD